MGTRIGKPPSGENVAKPPAKLDVMRMLSPSGDHFGEPLITDVMERSWSIVRIPAVSFTWPSMGEALIPVRITARMNPSFNRLRPSPAPGGTHFSQLFIFSRLTLQVDFYGRGQLVFAPTDFEHRFIEVGFIRNEPDFEL